MVSIGVVGINFKTADLRLRETMARSVQSLIDEQAIFFPYPTVVLSTCNRTEIYFSGEDLANVHSHLLSYLRLQIEEPFEQRLYSYFGLDGFVHLCRVAAGLDSAILAETEIQRQVKVAYARARFVSSPLHYAFQKALKVSKQVRNQFAIKRGSPTLYGTLWQMGSWTDRNILLVGYSEMNRGLLSFLLHKNIRHLSLCTRHSVQLEGVHVLPRPILERWQAFDVIVCATRADSYLIQGEGTSDHLLFDLSVPRNIDPQVGQTATLYNIDQVIERSQTDRHLEPSEALIWENAVKLFRIYRQKQQTPSRLSLAW